jgi:K+-sensing histidine kinase KdpD
MNSTLLSFVVIVASGFFYIIILAKEELLANMNQPLQPGSFRPEAPTLTRASPATTSGAYATTQCSLEPALPDELRRALMHEARTALVPILGFAEILEADRFEPEVRELAAYIKGGGQHLQLLIDDLVTLRDVEGHEEAPKPGCTAAEALMTKAVSASEHAARLVGVSLHQAGTTERRFAADPALVVRALQILLWVAVQCTARDRAASISASDTDDGVAFHVKSGSQFSSPIELASNPWRNADQISPLGIRLASAIARQHGGSLVLHPPLHSSFDATLTLPTA